VRSTTVQVNTTLPPSIAKEGNPFITHNLNIMSPVMGIYGWKAYVIILHISTASLDIGPKFLLSKLYK